MGTTKKATVLEELTDEQQAAYDDITARLEGGERFTSLLGYAGTGKTYLAGCLAAACTEAGRSVTCCAPTHKAAQVLRQKIGPAGGGEVPVCTLHALLGLRLVPDGRGDYHLAPEPRRSGDLYADLVIVDEASMVGAEEWAFVEQTAPHVQWLFVGDPAQLPPVGEGTSPALAQPGVALETVCRQQAGSSILKLATEVRTGTALSRGASGLEAAFDGDAGVATTRSRSAFTQSAVRAFGAEAFRKDAAHARLLAYRNRTVRRYNEAIRAALHGAGAPRFQKGEWLVARETWLFDGMPQLFNSEEVRVRKAKEGRAESEDRQTWRVWRLTVRGAGGGRTRGVEVLHEEETARFREELERRKQAALDRPARWKAFYALKERFAEVDYAYAMTVHKCLPAGALIETERGARPLAELRVGDLVWTGKNRLRPITSVFHTGRRRITRIETASGSVLESSPEHRFLTRRGWVEARGLRTSDTVAFARPSAARAPGEDDDAYLMGYLVGVGSYNYRSKTLASLEARQVAVPPRTQQLLETRHDYDPVASVAVTDATCEMMDIEVAEDHSFLYQGAVVHNSQGSTFDTAFVDAGDLAACRGAERQALGYVAVTRPARRLALLV